MHAAAPTANQKLQRLQTGSGSILSKSKTARKTPRCFSFGVNCAVKRNAHKNAHTNLRQNAVAKGYYAVKRNACEKLRQNAVAKKSEKNYRRLAAAADVCGNIGKFQRQATFTIVAASVSQTALKGCKPPFLTRSRPYGRWRIQYKAPHLKKPTTRLPTPLCRNFGAHEPFRRTAMTAKKLHKPFDTQNPMSAIPAATTPSVWTVSLVPTAFFGEKGGGSGCSEC